MIVMVYSDFSFNPAKDKSPVSQTGYVDLKVAFVNMSLPSQLPDAETDYNGIEDPASIMGKPRDVFEALEMQSRISDAEFNSEDSANR